MAGLSIPTNRGRPKKSEEQHQQGKSWDFTDFSVFDPETGLRDESRLGWWRDLDYTYLYMAKEVCPTSGKLHAQSRIKFRRNYRFDQLKKILPPDVHFSLTKCEADFNYAKKWGSECIINEDFRRSGTRNVFQEQRTSILEGSSICDIISHPHSNLQSLRSAEVLMSYLEPLRPNPTLVKVTVYASVALALADDPGSWTPPVGDIGLRFWSGYDAHESITLDCKLHSIGLTYLRSLCVSHPFTVNVKYGTRQARFSRINVIRPPEGFKNIAPFRSFDYIV